MPDGSGQPGSAPVLRPFARLVVDVGAPVDIGQTTTGMRRMVPILGGTVDGEVLSGRVLAGGADHQLVRADGTTELTARYVIATTDGDHVLVVNRAVRSGDAADMAALMRGEIVDPSRIYFRGSPVFQTGSPRLHDLTRRIYLATGHRLPSRVVLDFFEVG